MPDMQTFQLFADGSAICNPRRGGYGFILVGEGFEILGKGSEPRRHANRMELVAVLQGLEQLEKPSKVTVYTDSDYVIHQYRAPRKPLAPVNPLWDQLRAFAHTHEIQFIKVSKKRRFDNHQRAHHLAREAAFNNIAKEVETHVDSEICKDSHTADYS